MNKIAIIGPHHQDGWDLLQKMNFDVFEITDLSKKNLMKKDKVMKKLKWKPLIKLETGLKKTFLWYFNNNNYYSTLKRKDIIQRLGIKK